MKKKTIGIYILFFLILFGCFKLNPFKVYNNERTMEQIFANSPEAWSNDSESYVIGSLIESMKFGMSSGVGRLSRLHDENAEHWFYNVQITYKAFEEDNLDLANDFELYYSQLGGQGVLFRFINKALISFDGTTRLSIMRNINVILISLVLSIIAVYIMKITNLSTAIFFLMGLLLNQWLPISVTNLYWVSWSWFLPMAIAAIYCLKENPSKKTTILFYALIFLSVVFKCSSGYEFISTVLVAMIIPFVYKELSNFKSIIVSIKNLIIPTIIGIFGFLFTFILHILRYMLGGWDLKDSIEFLKIIIIKRTNGSLIPLGIDVEAWEMALSEPYLSLFKRYFNASSLNIVVGNNIYEIRFWMVFLLIITFGLILGYFIKDNKIEDKNKAINYILITLLSVLAPFSWYILARGHAAAHLLLDPILFYVPFIPMGFGLIGYTISKGVKKWNMTK